MPASEVGPRRILMSCDALGGVWRYALDLARSLREDGVKTLLVGIGPRPDRSAPTSELDGIALEWLDHPPAWAASDAEALRDLPQALAALARGFRADLVHLNQLAEAAGLENDVPVVVGAHSCLATWWAGVRGGPPPADWGWRVELDRAGLARADAIVAPSRSHAAALAEAYGPDLKVHVAPNSCAAPVGPGEKGAFVLAAGRWWDAGKNVAALDAAAEFVRWPVTLAGALAGPDGSRVELRHARSQGQCAPETMRALMAAAPIFVSPSLYEPFGLAALEAAHAGAALVLSDIPTYRELWESAAVFVDARDPGRLADALNALAEDGPSRARLVAAARARAAEYQPVRQAAALGAAYAAAMARPRPVREPALSTMD